MRFRNLANKVARTTIVEAVAVYREALKERTTERLPHDWAMIQNNLGITLARIGEREGGTMHLEEAVTAHREAIKERSRKHDPLNWPHRRTI